MTVLSTSSHPNALLRRRTTLIDLSRKHTGPKLIDTKSKTADTRTLKDPWVFFSKCVTCLICGKCLKLSGVNGPDQQQAWREKFALCVIIALLCAFVVFFTVALTPILCPASAFETTQNAIKITPASATGLALIHGYLYDLSNVNLPSLAIPTPLSPGQDISNFFTFPNTSCNGFTSIAATLPPTCASTSSCLPMNIAGLIPTGKTPAYDWETIDSPFYAIDGIVVNFIDYFNRVQSNSSGFSDNVDTELNELKQKSGVSDATFWFAKEPGLWQQHSCLIERYRVGIVNGNTRGCVAASIIQGAALVIILGVLFTRFIMAVVFDWFISARLTRPPKPTLTPPTNLTLKSSYAFIPTNVNGVITLRQTSNPLAMSTSAGARKQSISHQINNPTIIPSSIHPLSNGGQLSTSVMSHPTGYTYSSHALSNSTTLSSSSHPLSTSTPVETDAVAGTDPYVVMLVTCYSESEPSIRGTLSSLAATSYSDERKLLFVIADGLVKGRGEKRATWEVLIDMIDIDPICGNPKPYSYIAVGSGSKRVNMAKVYAGHFVQNGRRCPIVLIIKCGTPAESGVSKPGNRGKRDSQIILMNFFSKVFLNDRMCPLEYDLFRKIHWIMGVTPDKFELVLMVDADTTVSVDSLTLLTNAVQNDSSIMGLCGETRIANKKTSFTTSIQVFEYYISHHLGKAFESVFGGVTCLPGCFCMYRLKAPSRLSQPSENRWTPILADPDIVTSYSTTNTVTLHQKNLLLLGEDRFLSTLMLRSFPHRKMMFVPQATCKTVVPDEFSVLLSQRRRWVNSTIHNLLELVLVRDLCGTFFLSMQFVVMMDLLGTVVLPVAILLTLYLIFQTIIMASAGTLVGFASYAPLILLSVVLFTPAVLIVITTRKLIYVFWMSTYLIGLPIWNFVIPVYAFWHFDDFSWGETRQTEGGDTGHGDDHHGDDEESGVPLRKWAEYELAFRRFILSKSSGKQNLDSSIMNTPYPTPPTNTSNAILNNNNNVLPSSSSTLYNSNSDVNLHGPLLPSSSISSSNLIPMELDADIGEVALLSYASPSHHKDTIDTTSPLTKLSLSQSQNLPPPLPLRIEADVPYNSFRQHKENLNGGVSTVGLGIGGSTINTTTATTTSTTNTHGLNMSQGRFNNLMNNTNSLNTTNGHYHTNLNHSINMSPKKVQLSSSVLSASTATSTSSVNPPLMSKTRTWLPELKPSITTLDPYNFDKREAHLEEDDDDVVLKEPRLSIGDLFKPSPAVSSSPPKKMTMSSSSSSPASSMPTSTPPINKASTINGLSSNNTPTKFTSFFHSAMPKIWNSSSSPFQSYPIKHSSTPHRPPLHPSSFSKSSSPPSIPPVLPVVHPPPPSLPPPTIPPSAVMTLASYEKRHSKSNPVSPPSQLPTPPSSFPISSLESEIFSSIPTTFSIHPSPTTTTRTTPPPPQTKKTISTMISTTTPQKYPRHSTIPSPPQQRYTYTTLSSLTSPIMTASTTTTNIPVSISSPQGSKSGFGPLPSSSLLPSSSSHGVQGPSSPSRIPPKVSSNIVPPLRRSTRLIGARPMPEPMQNTSKKK